MTSLRYYFEKPLPRVRIEVAAMFSEQGWTTISHIAVFLKYSFTAATTALSVISLRHETTYKTSEAAHVRQLTPVGRYYMAGMIALAAITITTTVVGDIASGRLDQIKKQQAQLELDRALQGQLDKQLQNGIKPVLLALGTDVAQHTRTMLNDLEQQAKQSTARLRIAQDQLLDQTQQSAQRLTALNTGMVASAGLSRELLDKQQRLNEASSQVTYLSGYVDPTPWDRNVDQASAAIDARKAIFRGLPDIQTSLLVLLRYGRVSAVDVACPPGESSRTTPCLEGAGEMDGRLGPNGGYVAGFPFGLDWTDLRRGTSESGSALRFASDIHAFSQAKPPVRARDLEIDQVFLTLCVTPEGSLAKDSAVNQEAALRRLDKTLPASLDVTLQAMLRPLENGSEFTSNHRYTYVRIIDRSSQMTHGCLHPFYRLGY